MNIPDATRIQHDAILSIKPINYRGFTLKPLSHINHPHWIEERPSVYDNLQPGYTEKVETWSRRFWTLMKNPSLRQQELVNG